jgi:hypothetical protein
MVILMRSLIVEVVLVEEKVTFQGLEVRSRRVAYGNINPGDATAIFIRSALVDGAKARVYAGAGIVAGSAPEKEFAETELKFKAMLDAVLTP